MSSSVLNYWYEEVNLMILGHVLDQDYREYYTTRSLAFLMRLSGVLSFEDLTPLGAPENNQDIAWVRHTTDWMLRLTFGPVAGTH